MKEPERNIRVGAVASSVRRSIFRRVGAVHSAAVLDPERVAVHVEEPESDGKGDQRVPPQATPRSG
jgi:hypothetical protein